MTVPYRIYMLLGSIAEGAAAELGVPMAIALADHLGDLQYFIRMDATLPAAREIAVSKAYSAAALRMPTSELGKLALPGEPLYGIEHTHNGKIILFGGGFPLFVNGRVVGGIGISGGTIDEDECVAKAVVEAFDEMVQLAEIIRPRLSWSLAGCARLSVIEKSLWEAIRSIPLPCEVSTLMAGSVVLALQDHTRHPL